MVSKLRIGNQIQMFKIILQLEFIGRSKNGIKTTPTKKDGNLNEEENF